MVGGPDPDCRGAYPVAPSDDALALRGFVRAVARARHERRALRRGAIAIAAANGQAIALGRSAGGERGLVARNNGREPARGGGLARGVARPSAVALPGVAVRGVG